MESGSAGNARRGRMMSECIILDAEDVKKIIAEKFGVDPKDIIKTQYSYIIKKSKDDGNSR